MGALKSPWKTRLSEYCACFTNLMSKEMTLEEATLLSLDIMAAHDDEQGEKADLAVHAARHRARARVHTDRRVAD